MIKKDKKFYITTPIYYVNANPHIGHTYTTIAADILARYHRMQGDKTFFLTGTDEHGAKIEDQAGKAGLEPKEFVDQVAAKFQLAWDELNISNDRFIRTTEEDHKKAIQNALQYMYDKGDIYKGEYRGLYCRQCEQYKSEKDLVDGMCPDHKIAPEEMSEECYMFRQSKYQDELLKKIKSDEFKILPPERKNEIVSFYEKEKLQDVSFSRKNVKWGIPLPWDKSHTAYVWADALLNYLTGLGWSGSPSVPLNKGEEKSPLTPLDKRGTSQPPLLKGALGEFWPADVQLMSKDILRVHATIWPAMLLSLGLPLPRELFVHGFFLVEGQKMSKSIGNVIAPEDLIKKYGVDATRYLLMSATTFGHDGDISWKFFDDKYNADLANGIGNLSARVLTLVEKKLDGVVPKKVKSEVDSEKFIENYKDAMADLKLDQALFAILSYVKALDQLVEEKKVYKMSAGEIDKPLYVLLEALRQLAWMFLPVMPETAEAIWTSLSLESREEMGKNFDNAVEWGGLKAGLKIKKGSSLFPRI